MAICATTRALRPHRRLRPGSSPAADFNPFTRSARVLCSAGARPQKSAERTDSARLVTSTRVSIRNGTLTGNSVGIVNVLKNSMPTYPTTIPANPPSNARTRLSVRSSRISRKRPAPIARRTAISRLRVRARLKRSPAALVHATRSTASARIVKITPNFQLTSLSCVRISNWVRTAAPRSRFNFGYSCSKPRASKASSSRACRRVVPGFRRPLTVSSRSSRSTKKSFRGFVEKTRAIDSGT